MSDGSPTPPNKPIITPPLTAHVMVRHEQTVGIVTMLQAQQALVIGLAPGGSLPNGPLA